MKSKKYKKKNALQPSMSLYQFWGLDLTQQPVWFIALVILLAIWSLIWNGIGLWHAAQHKQKSWFIAILILNTLGLLPIVYLLWFKPKGESAKNKSKKK